LTREKELKPIWAQGTALVLRLPDSSYPGPLAQLAQDEKPEGGGSENAGFGREAEIWGSTRALSVLTDAVEKGF
jgi:hypothetical protein